MKSLFSKTWKASKQPRKQRKYRHNAPIHVRRKFLSSNLSKHLRKEYTRRSVKIRTEDLVKIQRGEFAGKEGKVLKINLSNATVFVEGASRKKAGGKDFNVPINASNVQIIELNTKDEKRNSALKNKIAPKAEKAKGAKEEKPESKETKKEEKK